MSTLDEFNEWFDKSELSGTHRASACEAWEASVSIVARKIYEEFEAVMGREKLNEVIRQAGEHFDDAANEAE